MKGADVIKVGNNAWFITFWNQNQTFKKQTKKKIGQEMIVQ